MGAWVLMYFLGFREQRVCAACQPVPVSFWDPRVELLGSGTALPGAVSALGKERRQL